MATSRQMNSMSGQAATTALRRSKSSLPVPVEAHIVLRTCKTGVQGGYSLARCQWGIRPAPLVRLMR